MIARGEYKDIEIPTEAKRVEPQDERDAFTDNAVSSMAQDARARANEEHDQEMEVDLEEESKDIAKEDDEAAAAEEDATASYSNEGRHGEVRDASIPPWATKLQFGITTQWKMSLVPTSTRWTIMPRSSMLSLLTSFTLSIQASTRSIGRVMNATFGDFRLKRIPLL